MISCSTYMTIVIYFYIYILYIIRSVLRIFSEFGGRGAILSYGSLVSSFMAFYILKVYPYIIYSDE